MKKIESIEERLSKYKRLQNEINYMNNVINQIMTLQRELVNDSVVVRLGDLIKELASLLGINEEEIDVRIDTAIAYFGKYSMSDFTKMRTGSLEHEKLLDDNTLLISLFDKMKPFDEKRFDYPLIAVPFGMEDIQADGKTMYEHMGVDYRIEPFGNRGIYTMYVVDKKIKNIILNIPLEYLTFLEDSKWYPSDVFTTAVMNCAKKSYNSRNQYVRTRAREK